MTYEQCTYTFYVNERNSKSCTSNVAYMTYESRTCQFPQLSVWPVKV